MLPIRGNQDIRRKGESREIFLGRQGYQNKHLGHQITGKVVFLLLQPFLEETGRDVSLSLEMLVFFTRKVFDYPLSEDRVILLYLEDIAIHEHTILQRNSQVLFL